MLLLVVLKEFAEVFRHFLKQIISDFFAKILLVLFSAKFEKINLIGNRSDSE